MESDLLLMVLVLQGTEPHGLDHVLGQPAVPFLNWLKSSAAWGAVETPEDKPAFCPLLLKESMAVKGQGAGLVNLAWTEPPPPEPAFFIGKEQGRNGKPVILPRALADDLADYLPDPPPPEMPLGPDLAGGKADVAFAEQAAVTRIRMEHTRRLAQKFKPSVLAVNLGGLALTRNLFGAGSGRFLLFLSQLDTYFDALRSALRPASIALAGDSGLLAVSGPGIKKGGNLGQISTAAAGDLLADMVKGNK